MLVRDRVTFSGKLIEREVLSDDFIDTMPLKAMIAKGMVEHENNKDQD